MIYINETHNLLLNYLRLTAKYYIYSCNFNEQELNSELFFTLLRKSL